MKNERIILAGGTGTMGRIMQQHFIGQGSDVVVLTMTPHESQHPGTRVLEWDGKTAGAWTSELEGAVAVINLAGRSVDCRYTAANKTEILNSRVNATRVLGEAIARCAQPPAVWINMSSATVYRHAEHSAMDEITGEIGTDFSPQVVLAWEKEFFTHKRDSVRQLAVRCAMVFSPQGGAFPRFRQLTRMGLGGHHGSGKQFVSWVHEADVASFFDWAIHTPSVQGIINLAAPHPVRELGLMSELRKRLKPLVAFNVPTWMLGIGAFLLRTEVELVLKSRRVVPTRAVQLGFAFQHSRIETALDDLMDPRAQNPRTMSMLSRLLHCDGRTDRLTYQRNVALLVASKLVADSLVLAFLSPGISWGLTLYGWLNPFALIGPWLDGTMSTLICGSTFLFFTGLVWNSVHRMRDTGYAHWLGGLSAVPFVSVPVTLFLSFAARQRRSVFDLN